MQTEDIAVRLPAPVAAEAFALNLLNLADQLDDESIASAAVEPPASVPDPAADSSTSPTQEAGTSGQGELDAYEPPALDAQVCLRAFPVLNPRCHREIGRASCRERV